MSQPCVITACKRPSRVVCDCCQQRFCLPHLNEHNNSLVSQLNPFVDEINALGNRLTGFDVEKMTDDCRQKLEQWRVDCHKKIDQFFEQKCQEIDDLMMKVDKQREEIDRLRLKVAKLIDEQEATRQDIEGFTSGIENLKREMSQIEQESIQLNVRPLLVDDRLIHFESEFELTTLPPACKTIIFPRDSRQQLTSNDRFLLIHQAPNLCLIDRELTIVKQAPWDHGNIRDMCWSRILERFIVITPDYVFLVDENTISIDTNIPTVSSQQWRSAACSDTSLFLSTKVWGSSIAQYTLLPSIQLVKQWQFPITCTKDEAIDTMVYNDQKLAAVIINRSKETVHIELRSSSTLDRLWSLSLDIAFYKDMRVTCGLFRHDEWLVVDRNASRLLHITKNGEMQATYAYNPAPWRTNLFGTNVLAVSTRNGVNFHKL